MRASTFRATLFNAATLTTVSSTFSAGGLRKIVIYLDGTGTINAGVITVEEAHDDAYAGTWSLIDDTNATDLSAGKEVAVHLPEAGYGYVRVRISTEVGGGGSVTARVIAQGA